ncbi:sulfur carrier protein ThiS [Parendozoicomonas sp. Alg238-R29]|uniref:sulfur carrier protein ThiS n=1 Tax=Parendozoicomonas sp. Alg238-R29 TaxID=2993446 RepID=UPI00248E49BB|nr:sulfur carrier protein ThiS [Parendozoicomonas sp. Alg238-R29]
MQITVNNQPRELGDIAITLTQLLAQMNVPEAGTAIALNQNVVSRSSWNDQTLEHGDQVMIIRATAGG